MEPVDIDSIEFVQPGCGQSSNAAQIIFAAMIALTALSILLASGWLQEVIRFRNYRRRVKSPTHRACQS
jgi:hypothetical protein